MKLYKQETDYTCGPACLLMAMSVFGVSLPEEDVATIAKTNSDIGTSRSNMKKAARAFGFKVNSGTSGDLGLVTRQITTKPVIVLFKDDINSFHYSLIVSVDEEVSIADPWSGEVRKIPRDKFVKDWVCHNGSKAWWMTMTM